MIVKHLTQYLTHRKALNHSTYYGKKILLTFLYFFALSTFKYFSSFLHGRACILFMRKKKTLLQKTVNIFAQVCGSNRDFTKTLGTSYEFPFVCSLLLGLRAGSPKICINGILIILN